MGVRVIFMGVAGSGKSSIGAAVAEATGIPYIDGDDLHTPENVAKMAAGIPLDDDDRAPWLDRVAEVLKSQAPVMVGCSALKRRYRDRIRAGAGGHVHFVYLEGSRALIAERMAGRTGHYMPTTLLDSQFAALEVPGPDEGLSVSIDQPLWDMVDEILPWLEVARLTSDGSHGS